MLHGRVIDPAYSRMLIARTDLLLLAVRTMRLNGTWVFRGTRVPLRALFENLDAGASTTEFLEWFPDVEPEQVHRVLEYVTKSAAAA